VIYRSGGWPSVGESVVVGLVVTDVDARCDRLQIC